jgi:hypothetical protein
MTSVKNDINKNDNCIVGNKTVQTDIKIDTRTLNIFDRRFKKIPQPFQFLSSLNKKVQEGDNFKINSKTLESIFNVFVVQLNLTYSWKKLKIQNQ